MRASFFFIFSKSHKKSLIADCALKQTNSKLSHFNLLRESFTSVCCDLLEFFQKKSHTDSQNNEMSAAQRKSSSSSSSAPPTVAQQALRLLDQRRIRRQAIVRDFDLMPDGGLDDHHNNNEENNTTTISSNTGVSPSSSKTQHSPNKQHDQINSSSSPSTKKDSAADFRLFGRLIPPGVYRDRTRQYLLTDFSLLTTLHPDEEASVSSSSSNAADLKNHHSKTKATATLPASELLLSKKKAEEEQRAAETTDSLKLLTLQSGMRKRVNRRKLFDNFVAESKLHRKLFDAAIGELSTDLANPGSASGILAEASAADGRFRKLVRSCDPEIVEQLQQKLVANRQKLPLFITSTTMYIRGAFPDRPPSPRTLSLQRRRIRLAEILKSTSDFESIFLPPRSSAPNPASMFWNLNFLLKGATLAPKGNFFSSMTTTAPTSTTTTTTSPKRSQSFSNLARGVSFSSPTTNLESVEENHHQPFTIVIPPQKLADNLRTGLPWAALTDAEVDWLMGFFAPEYQRVVERNKEAVRKAKNPSLLIVLARTRRDQLGSQALDADLRNKLRAYEDECKIMNPPNEAVDFEAGVKRLMRGLADALNSQHVQQQQNVKGSTVSSSFLSTRAHTNPLNELPSIALLCYSSLLPKALRHSRAVLGANASSPPPALTKEWLALAEAEYSAEGEEEMASLVSRFSGSWHAHFVHVSCGIDVDTLVLETETEQEQDKRRKRAGAHPQFDEEVKDTGTKSSTEQGAHHETTSLPSQHSHVVVQKRKIIQRDPPHQFSPEMQEFIGDGSGNAGGGGLLEDCPVCTMSSMVDSNYSYIDSNILNNLRNEARGDLVETFEKIILRNLWSESSAASTTTAMHGTVLNTNSNSSPTRNLEAFNRTIGNLVNSRNNLNPLEEAMLENRERRNFVSEENRDDDVDVDDDDANGSSTAAHSIVKPENILLNKNWRFDLTEFTQDMKGFHIQSPSSDRSKKINWNSSVCKKGEMSVKKTTTTETNDQPEEFRDHSLSSSINGGHVSLPPFSLTTVNNRYFDCFATHLGQSPLFASMMCALMLKQIVILAGGGKVEEIKKR